MRPAALAVAAFRKGDASIPELLDATLSAIAEADSTLNSFITLADRDDLERQANALQSELQAKGPRGPLHGIPLGVKDVIDTKGLRTTGGSEALGNHVPDSAMRGVSSCCAMRARSPSARTDRHRFAFGVTTDNARFGQCHNPWNPDRIPGGSSGGSGAAVGGGLVIGSTLRPHTGSSTATGRILRGGRP